MLSMIANSLGSAWRQVKITGKKISRFLCKDYEPADIIVIAVAFFIC